MIELIKNPKIDFMGLRKFAFIFSGLFSLLGIVAIVQIVLGNANLGIDFVGGTAVQVKFQKQVALADVRKVITEKAGIKDFDLQDLPTVKKVLIQVKRKGDTVGEFSDKIIDTLRVGFKDNTVTVDSVSEIGPKVGRKLRQDAMWALIASAVGILLYVSWRFAFRFSVGATVATIHDILVVLAVFYATGREMNLIFLTALLTIAGYSLTDTVVVFDRVRENLALYVKDPVLVIINRSINEVLSRTIITSFTALLSGIALYLVGGEILHGFSEAIIVGILIGTYSSVFVATPIALLGGGEKKLKKHP